MNILIQAVPWDDVRANNAQDLAAATGGAIVWDKEHSGYATFLDVMGTFGDEAGILLEDDIILCPQWKQKTEAVIEEHRDDVIRFFSYFPDDAELGPRWQSGKTYAQNQCVYYPAGVAADFVKYAATKRRSQFAEKYHDMMFARFLHSRRQPFWLHVPSLVQHMTIPSVVMTHRRKRVSPTFERA